MEKIKTIFSRQKKDEINYDKINTIILNTVCYESFEDRAFGCVLGAFIGDSVGSYQEFTRTISPETLRLCMSMPGGGTYGLGPGQVTDDSELAMCLMQGIVDSNKDQQESNTSYFDIDCVATLYRDWVNSPPFDIGITTSNALVPLT